jgi:hypothetical protein
MKRYFAAIVLAVLFSAGFASAQLHPLKIFVSTNDNANSESRDAVSRLSGRIGASNRYALVSNMTDASVVVYVLCLEFSTRNSGHVGIACSIGYTYYPWKNQGAYVSVPIDGSLDVGREMDVTESQFDDFIRSTSDENLAKVKAANLVFINLTILGHPEGLK